MKQDAASRIQSSEAKAGGGGAAKGGFASRAQVSCTLPLQVQHLVKLRKACASAPIMHSMSVTQTADVGQIPKPVCIEALLLVAPCFLDGTDLQIGHESLTGRVCLTLLSDIYDYSI